MFSFASTKDILGAALYEPLLGSVLASLRRCVVRLAVPRSIPTNFRILDCCCGAGGLLSMLAQAIHGRPYDVAAPVSVSPLVSPFVNDGRVCIGLDRDVYMLAECKKRTAFASVYVLRADAISMPFASKSITVATACMALHTMPYATALRVVQELQRVSQSLILADYCLAERNIFLPSAAVARTVEMLVGGTHYANYKIFMKRGALEGLLYEAGCKVVERYTVLGGIGRVVLL